tara:strand:- start:1615 stop:1968 length:354 start_codon:yes stop_codon:yes gene_type:complete
MKNTLAAVAAALAFGLPLATTGLADTNLNTGDYYYTSLNTVDYYTAPVLAVTQNYPFDAIAAICAVGVPGPVTGSAYGPFELSGACSFSVDGKMAIQSLYSPVVIEYATAEIGGEQG